MSDDPLDQTNRFLVSTVALVVAFVAALIVLLAWGASDASIDRLDDFAGWLRDHDDNAGKLIVTLGATVVALLMLTLIIVELTPSPTQRMRVRSVGKGDASITTKEIAQRIEEEARAVPHVAQCAAVVAARGHRVEVVLDVHVDPGADLARTADDVCRRAHELVEQRVGIGLVKPPYARMHYRELRLRSPEGAPQQPFARTESERPVPPSGWERPAGERTEDERGSTDSPEEAQA
jgi:hypothetical protein